MKIKDLSLAASYLIVLSTLILTSQSHAQGTSRSTNAKGRLMNSFNQSAPAIGDKLPQLNGFNSDGQPWNTELLKDHHTVLVFGCLT